MRTRTSAACALLLTLGLSSASAQETLSVFNQGNGAIRTVTEAAAAILAKKHPRLKTEIKVTGYEAFRVALPVALTSSTPPDVFFNWNGDVSNRYVREGHVTEIGTLGDGRWNAFLTPELRQGYMFKGKEYGVPVSQQTAYFFYNKAMFEKLKLSPPKTMGELRGMCKAIRAADPALTPISLGSREPGVLIQYISMFFARAVAAEVRDADYGLTAPADKLFTDPGYELALKELTLMQDDGCFNEGVNSVSPDEARSMFSSEISVMTFCGTFCVAPLAKEGFSGKYDAFEVPMVDGGTGDPKAMYNSLNGYQISNKTANPELAAEFINIYLSPEIQAQMTEANGRLPVNPEALKYLKNPDPMILRAIKDLPNLGATVVPLDTLLVAQLTDVVRTGSQRLMNEELTPAAFVAQLHDTAVAAQAAAKQ